MLSQQGHLLFRQPMFFPAVLHRSGAVDKGDGLRICFSPLKVVHGFAVYNLVSGSCVKESPVNMFTLTLNL